MRDADHSEDIVLKRSGKRARLDVTLDDEPAAAVAGVVIRRPRSAPATQAPSATADLASAAAVVPVPAAAPPAGMQPPGGPPIIYVHDEPGGSWWQSRSASITAVVVLLVAAIVVACVLLLGGKDGKQPIATELANTHNAMQSALGQAGRATKLAQIRSAGRNAYRQTSRLDSPAANVGHQSDADLARPAAQLIGAERAYLSALTHLGQVNYAAAADHRLTHWKSIRARIADAQRPLLLAAAKVDDLDLPTSVGTILVTRSELDATLDRLDATVTGANHQIVLYEQRLKTYRSSKKRALGNAQPLVEYRDRVGQILSSYAQGRHEVSLWAEDAVHIHPPNAEDAAVKVRGFISAREDIISQLDGALDAAPVQVRTTHRDLGVPLRESLEGLTAAAAAIEETALSTDDETNPTRSSSWIAFQDASKRVESTLGTARAAWDRAIASQIHEARSHGIAMHPTKPKV
jgi:outer membrane murein-binding lipoprotein Lpp